MKNPLTLVSDSVKGYIAERAAEARYKTARTFEMMRKAYEFVEHIIKVPIHRFKDYRSYLNASSNKLWASFRACHMVACVVLSTKFIVRAVDNTGELTSTVPRLPPELAKLLTQPNPFMSMEEMIYLYVHHMKSCGVAYWVMDRTDLLGRPEAIYPLFPQYVSPIPDAKKWVGGYEYRVNGKIITFQAHEVIYFRRPSPRDSIKGLGDIEAAEPLFNNAINADTYKEKFMANGAQPSGVLMRDEAIKDPTEWKKFRDYFRENYQGKDSAGKTLLLNGKHSYEQLGLTSVDMQEIEGSKWTIEQIFLAHGVPLSVAGFSNASNYATARQDDINFRKYECCPLVDIFVGKLNQAGGLIRSFNDGWRMTYQISGLIDVEQVVKDYEPLVKCAAMTRNELREAVGLEKSTDPALDEFIVFGQWTPSDMIGLADGTDPKATQAAQRIASGFRA